MNVPGLHVFMTRLAMRSGRGKETALPKRLKLRCSILVNGLEQDLIIIEFKSII